MLKPCASFAEASAARVGWSIDSRYARLLGLLFEQAMELNMKLGPHSDAHKPLAHRPSALRSRGAFRCDRRKGHSRRRGDVVVCGHTKDPNCETEV